MMLKIWFVSCSAAAAVECGQVVKGSIHKDASEGENDCECPDQSVVSGTNPVCQAKWDNFDPSFSSGDASFQALTEGECECKHRPGCGVVRYSVDQILPANAELAGLPPAITVGTRENMDIGVQELNENWYGIWWMKGNPVPEELATFAFAYSRLSGSNVPLEDVDWPLTARVPNAGKNRWVWPDTTIARTAIMPMYTDANMVSNNFTMFNATDGDISTGLTDVPLVWVESFSFHKIDENQWLRPTIFQDRAPYTWFFGSRQEYTLTRIVNEDGTPTQPYFDQFKQKVTDDGVQLLVFDADNECKRSCMLSSSNTCKYCHESCKGVIGPHPESGSTLTYVLAAVGLVICCVIGAIIRCCCRATKAREAKAAGAYSKLSA